MREALNKIIYFLLISVSLNSYSVFSQDDNLNLPDERFDLSLEKKIERDLKKVRKQNNASEKDIEKFAKKHNVDLNSSEVQQIENSAPVDQAPSQAGASGIDDLENSINETVNDLGGVQIDSTTQEKILEKVKNGDLPLDLLKGKTAGTTMSAEDNILAEKSMFAMIDEISKNNPFSKMSKEELFSLIEERVKGTKAEKIVNACPKCKTFFVDYIRHPQALGKLMLIVKEKEQLKIYGAVVFGLFILSIFINLVLLRKLNFFVKLIARIIVMVSVMVANLLALYFFFPDNLDPSIEVFKSTFL